MNDLKFAFRQLLKNPGFTAVAVLTLALGIGADPARLSGIRASASLFPLLRVQPELGRGFTEAEDTFGGDRVAVIAHRLWQERFGGATDVLGKSVTLDGNSYTIVGVMPDGFRFAGLDADVWLPMAFEPWELENRGGHNYQA